MRIVYNTFQRQPAVLAVLIKLSQINLKKTTTTEKGVCVRILKNRNVPIFPNLASMYHLIDVMTKFCIYILQQDSSSMSVFEGQFLFTALIT